MIESRSSTNRKHHSTESDVFSNWNNRNINIKSTNMTIKPPFVWIIEQYLSTDSTMRAKTYWVHRTVNSGDLHEECPVSCCQHMLTLTVPNLLNHIDQYYTSTCLLIIWGLLSAGYFDSFILLFDLLKGAVFYKMILNVFWKFCNLLLFLWKK